jgi:hypothetical protein
MGRVTDTESFIKEATIIHNGRYDYSLVEYTRTDEYVNIICREHGIFRRRANNHLYGEGCVKCHDRKVGRKRNLITQRNESTLCDGKRKCSKCGRYLDLNSFYKMSKVFDGLNSQCKDCVNMTRDEWRIRNEEQILQKRKVQDKIRWQRFKDKHKEEIEQKHIQRELVAIEKRQNAKVARRLRAIIRHNTKKTDTPRPHMLELLGCSVDEFKKYISSLFTEGMTWENNTYKGWHLDHIKPIASFPNLKTSIEEQRECFHYTNYQPLWWRDNMKKGSKYGGIRYGKCN